MIREPLLSRFLQYLAEHEAAADDPEKIPSLDKLSAEIGISVPKLREELEVARAMGLVEVKPRTGIRQKSYSFFPAVRHSLRYAVAVDWKHFDRFADLRRHLEMTYWVEAARLLTPEDHQQLQALVVQAWEKLNGEPVILPHGEHRSLHMTVFRRLDNLFVKGILEAYWDAYEAVGLNRYTDYDYLQRVWQYHQKMVDAICISDFDTSFKMFVEHTELLKEAISGQL